MDIKKFAVNPTARLALRDANDVLMLAENGQEVAVNVYGPGSKQYAAAQAAQQNRLMDSLKRKGKTDKTAEQNAAESAEFLADCTASFENLEYDALTGDALSRAVYSDITIGFIAGQIGKFLGDWANFTKASPQN